MNSSASDPDLSISMSVNPNVVNSLIGDKSGTPLTEAHIGSPDVDGNLIGGPEFGAIDPVLAPLADNGGVYLPDGSRLPTRAPLPGSPAINAGDPEALAGEDGVPMHDQRGEPFLRVYGGRIDIGAFEAQPTDVLAGDYNRDGVVNTADYSVWRASLDTNDAIGTGADGNGDGLVDIQDYHVWKANYGSSLDDLAVDDAVVASLALSASTDGFAMEQSSQDSNVDGSSIDRQHVDSSLAAGLWLAERESIAARRSKHLFRGACRAMEAQSDSRLDAVWRLQLGPNIRDDLSSTAMERKDGGPSKVSEFDWIDEAFAGL
jgi:hypothetical protein